MSTYLRREPKQSTYQLTFAKSMAALQPILTSAGPPLTSIHAYANARSQKTVLFRDYDENDTSSQSSRQHQVDSTSPAATASRHLRPTALNMIDKDQVDEAAGQTVFGIGSLVKHLIILAYLILEKSGSLSRITLHTRTREAYNSVLTEPHEARITQFSRDPTIAQSAVHYTSFAPANRFLFSPDGEFLPTDDELIESLAEITENWMEHARKKETDGGVPKVAYSNLSHVVIALVLVKATKKGIAEVLQDVLFTPLRMTRTTLSRRRLEELNAEPNHNVAQGFRLSADLEHLFAVPDHDYMASTVAQATVGAWSCTDDLAKLYKEILKGYRGHSDLFSREITEAFLAPRLESDQDDVSMTFAGYMCDSRSPNLGCDSLNKELGGTGKHKDKLQERLRRRFGEVEYLHYKGGTVDGFTSTVYLCVSEEVFAIVLSNSTGPLDFSEPAARCVVQEILLGSVPSHLVPGTQSHLKAAALKWRQLELENKEQGDWSGDLRVFSGMYVDSVTGRALEIAYDRATFRAKDRILFQVKVAARGNHVRLFPSSQGVFVDRVTFWRDLTFELRKDGSRSVLVGNDGAERYTKLV